MSSVFKKLYLGGVLCVFLCTQIPFAQGAELLQDEVSTVKAKVIEVQKLPEKNLEGLEVESINQTLTVKILEGDDKDRVVSFVNDYVQLKKGDIFFLDKITRAEDRSIHYAVGDPNRLPVLYFFGLLFFVLVLIVGGKQGLRGIIALAGSLALILYVLLPGILHGHSPVGIAMGVSSLIIVLGSYVTHGFNKTTSAAVLGMIGTVIITGSLAYIAIHVGRFSGYGTEEAVYLNLNTRGGIDILGLFLAGIMIGLLGVLYDVAISQAISVEELHHIAPHVPRKAIFKRALRIGREHIGALVNTLAIAYVGASLPLLLLFSQPGVDASLVVNHEIFSGEIIRILIGSIGLVIAVPITTVLATLILIKKKGQSSTDITGEYTAIENYSHRH